MTRDRGRQVQSSDRWGGDEGEQGEGECAASMLAYHLVQSSAEACVAGSEDRAAKLRKQVPLSLTALSAWAPGTTQLFLCLSRGHVLPVAGLVAAPLGWEGGCARGLRVLTCSTVGAGGESTDDGAHPRLVHPRRGASSHQPLASLYLTPSSASHQTLAHLDPHPREPLPTPSPAVGECGGVNGRTRTDQGRVGGWNGVRCGRWWSGR